MEINDTGISGKRVSMRCFFICMILAAGYAPVYAQAPAADSTDWDKVFTRIPVMAEFKGGEVAWIRFLHKHLSLPSNFAENDFNGKVVVQFVVSSTGRVSDIKLTSKTDRALAREIIRVISLSNGMWTPAVACGRLVTSYKTITINCIKPEQ